jgi:hypothetical protein
MNLQHKPQQFRGFQQNLHNQQQAAPLSAQRPEHSHKLKIRL